MLAPRSKQTAEHRRHHAVLSSADRRHAAQPHRLISVPQRQCCARRCRRRCRAMTIVRVQSLYFLVCLVQQPIELTQDVLRFDFDNLFLCVCVSPCPLQEMRSERRPLRSPASQQSRSRRGQVAHVNIDPVRFEPTGHRSDARLNMKRTTIGRVIHGKQRATMHF
jgi:hypothetical protein